MSTRHSERIRNILKMARRTAVGLLGYPAGLSPAKVLPITGDIPETPAIQGYMKSLLALPDRPTNPAAEPFLTRMNAFPYWYQRVDFPELGLSTAHASTHMLEEKDRAVRLTHPQLKWAFIRDLVLAKIGSDATVLELGSNAGFFSFEIARRAARVIAVEGLKTYAEQFALCREIFTSCSSSADTMGRLEGVNVDVDFTPLRTLGPVMAHGVTHTFTSDVIVHLRFPFLALHQMLEIPSQGAFLDFEMPLSFANLDGIVRLAVQAEHNYHHFFFSESAIDHYLQRVGIPAGNISKFRYRPYHLRFNRQRRDMYRVMYYVRQPAQHLRGPLQASDDPGHRISPGPSQRGFD